MSVARRIQRQAEVYSWRTADPVWRRVARFPVPAEWASDPEMQGTLAAPRGHSGRRWDEHIQNLDTLLNEYHDNKIDSRSMFGQHDPITKTTRWNADRVKMHQDIVNELVAQMANIPRQKRAILMAGLGGAGKTWVQNQPFFGVDAKQFFVLSADNIKEMMAARGMMPTAKHDPRFAGHSPMELSSLIHLESDEIAKRVAEIATEQGTNVIWDYRMANLPSALERIGRLRSNGYKDIGAFLVNVDPQRALKSAISRHKDGQQAWLDSGGSDPAKQGGRWLPSFAHHEGSPTPGSGMMSSSQEAFNQLITQHADLLPMGYGSIDNRVRGKPVFQGGSGQWANLNIPQGHPDTLAPTPPTPTLVSARRWFMADEHNLYETDPYSVRGILNAYRAEQIDYPTLVSEIVNRFMAITPIADDPARAGWSQYMHSEMMPGDDDGFWLSCAVSLGVLTPEQLDEILDAIHQSVHNEPPPVRQANSVTVNYPAESVVYHSNYIKAVGDQLVEWFDSRRQPGETIDHFMKQYASNPDEVAVAKPYVERFLGRTDIYPQSGV
jgi:hypothetical protein